jgi:hypothetical protein
MELCDRGSLKNLREELDGPMPEEMVWSIIAALAKVCAVL